MNSKFNKKKKMLVILSIVLMLTMVVGMGAFTFAKYVTTQTADDQANTAQWGFVITADASKLFGTKYTLPEGTGTSATVVETGSGVAVQATGTGNVVAPGTTGSMSFSISGKAEVRAKVSLAKAPTTDIHLDAYYPVKWTITESGTIGESVNETSVRTDMTLSDALAYLESKVDGIGSIEPGTVVNKTYVISWTWVFDSKNNQWNQWDTVLGLLAGGKTVEQINDIYKENTVTAGNYSTSIDFGFTVTVEQTQSAS